MAPKPLQCTSLPIKTAVLVSAVCFLAFVSIIIDFRNVELNRRIWFSGSTREERAPSNHTISDTTSRESNSQHSQALAVVVENQRKLVEQELQQQHDAENNGDQRPKLLIIGAAQNAEEHLPQLKRNFERLANYDGFQFVRMIIYENDSVDKTVEKLRGWEKSICPMTIISETNMTFESRTIGLAYIRNLLWKHVRLVKEKFDAVMMVDVDDVNYHLAHLSQCLGLPKNWTVCCANQYR